jgi:hypothetical protein
MKREQLLEKYKRIIISPMISKFEELIDFLNTDLGVVLYDELKAGKDDLLNILNSLGQVSPKETFYVWQHFYNYLTEKEHANGDRISFGTLYFWMGNTLYSQNEKGYGRFYLKAYVEDVGLHLNHLKGGAIQALRVYCYLGQKGIDLLNKTLQNATGTKSLIELRECIAKISRAKFERLIVEIENQFSLEGNEYFFLPLTALKAKILEIEPLIKVKKKENKTKAKLLEQFCQLLFGSVNGFRYKLDERSTLFQLDGLIENSSDHPFLKELGSTITVEAKQYFHERSIGRPIIDILAMNMVRVGATSAFLVTTANLTESARDEIYHTYLRQGVFIIPLYFNEIKGLCEEAISFPVLISTKISSIKSKRKL